jgi:DNA repair protein RecO (recombination protein O)
MPRPERSFRTPGIILKRQNFAESDRLLTVLTPKHGKLSVIAKGARKPTSTKTGHVELFTVVDMLVSRGRTFDILTQVEVQQTLLPLREDIQRGAYASYAAELMDRFTTLGEEEFNGAFGLLTETLQRLCEEMDSRLVIRYYELCLLAISGFQPELTHCVLTGEEILAQDQFFSFAEGGVVSPEAARHSTALVGISLPVLKLLRHMQRSPFSHVQSLTISSELHQDIERLMLGFITFILESRLQSVDFIRKIRAQS